MNIIKKTGLTLLLATASMLSINANAEPKVVAVVDVAPEFPQSAMRRETTGYVTVRFDVDKNGKARNINVVEVVPDRTFKAAALTALRRSSFQVLDDQGQAQAVAVENVERTYRFDKIESESRSVGMN